MLKKIHKFILYTTSLVLFNGQLINTQVHANPANATKGLEETFFKYTPTTSRGYDTIYQITDLFGISMGGPSGLKLNGLGFPEKTMVWDGIALENTYKININEQSRPSPIYTKDAISIFSK